MQTRFEYQIQQKETSINIFIAKKNKQKILFHLEINKTSNTNFKYPPPNITQFIFITIFSRFNGGNVFLLVIIFH